MCVRCLLTGWGLSGRQRHTGEVALASSGFTVGSSVGDSRNLCAPGGTAATSFSPSVVPFNTSKKNEFNSLYRPNMDSHVVLADSCRQKLHCLSEFKIISEN